MTEWEKIQRMRADLEKEETRAFDSFFVDFFTLERWAKEGNAYNNLLNMFSFLNELRRNQKLLTHKRFLEEFRSYLDGVHNTYEKNAPDSAEKKLFLKLLDVWLRVFGVMASAAAKKEELKISIGKVVEINRKLLYEIVLIRHKIMPFGSETISKLQNILKSKKMQAADVMKLAREELGNLKIPQELNMQINAFFSFFDSPKGSEGSVSGDTIGFYFVVGAMVSVICAVGYGLVYLIKFGLKDFAAQSAVQAAAAAPVVGSSVPTPSAPLLVLFSIGIIGFLIFISRIDDVTDMLSDIKGRYA